MRIQLGKYRYLTLVAALALTGCDKSHGQDGAVVSDSSDQASFPPSKERLLSVLASGYISAPDARQECLGRLVFDLRQPIHWSTNFDKFGSLFNGSFSANVFDRGDVIEVGDTKIDVFGPVDSIAAAEILETTPRARMRSLKDSLALINVYIAKRTKKPGRSDGEKRLLDESLADRATLEESIKKRAVRYEAIDTGLPDTEAYWTTSRINELSSSDSVYLAYMVRGDYVFVFESGVQLSPTLDREQHKRQFLKLLRDFRPRKPYEIPTELGICIPYGFILDDGTTFTDIKRSIRWPDAPGVIYTIHTGYVDRHHMKVTPLLALGNASAGLMGSPNEKQLKQFITQRIGPRAVKFGGVTGEQGGIAAHITMPGEPPYETYSVFSGYSGWLGIAALPYMLVEMRTFTTMQAPELKSNPPPFKQSMERLEYLLTSMRLRRTTPEMPEIAAARKQ